MQAAAPLPDEVVVDLATGTGLVSAALVRRARPPRMVGVDSSPAMLARRGRRAARVPAALADATGIPLGTSTVDVLLAAWLLHVVSRGDRRRVLSEVARVVRPGGRAVLVVPGRPPTPGGRAIRWLGTRTANGRLALSAPSGLDDELAAAGLDLLTRRITSFGYAADVVLLERR